MEISDEMMIDDISKEIEERRSKQTIPVFHPSMRHDVPLTWRRVFGTMLFGGGSVDTNTKGEEMKKPKFVEQFKSDFQKQIKNMNLGNN